MAARLAAQTCRPLLPPHSVFDKFGIIALRLTLSLLPSRCSRARWERGSERDPRKLVLCPYRSCRRKRLWLVQRGYGNIHGWRVGRIFKKDLCSAARCKPSHPARIGNTAERPTNQLKLFPPHNAPGQKRRSRTAAAIDAMTVDHSKRWFSQLIQNSAAKTAPVEVHITLQNSGA